jgi:putative membrane protein
LVALLGLALAALLIVEEGLGGVFGAIHQAGWGALVAITLFHAIPTALCGLAWWFLLRPFNADARTKVSIGWPLLSWVRWLRDGIDGVLPVVPVSGELVATRILRLRGIELGGASIVVDLTAELLSQAIFAAIGLAALVATHPKAPHKLWVLAGIAIMAAEFLGFLWVQKKGLFRLVNRPLDWLRGKGRRPEANPEERTLNDRILLIYRHRGAFFASIAMHLVAWIVGAVEAWIVLWFMAQTTGGQPLGWAEILALEGLVYALRSVAFFVPLGAGVQEGGYVLIGALVGLAAGPALAISLIKRGRDILIGLPALLLWQAIEGRAARKNAKRNAR